MALKDEISRETVKLKNMTFRKKVEYIWGYYKIPIILFIAAVIFVVTFIRDWRINKRPVFLSVAVINSDLAYSDNIPMKSDYITYAGVDTDKYNLDFDTGFLISDDPRDQISLMNSQKLIALFAAGSIDVLIGPDDMIGSYGAQGALTDISLILPADLKTRLENAGYEIFYTTEYDEDEAGNLKQVGTYPAGVYLDRSEYINGLGMFETKKEEGRRPVFAVANCATNPDNAFKLLSMLAGL
ncbi:MAG: hypothetical protein K6F34_01505 [Lachnospiraceae bacterium]|nr:hypothetical protein [Lachnospiraceae bacterium]